MTTPNDKASTPLAPTTSPQPRTSTTQGQVRSPIDVMHIKTGMPIVCSENGVVGVVDHMEGKQSIKVDKDKDGVHHYIPINWVARVDDKVHLDRPGKQAKREWSRTVILS